MVKYITQTMVHDAVQPSEENTIIKAHYITIIQCVESKKASVK